MLAREKERLKSVDGDEQIFIKRPTICARHANSELFFTMEMHGEQEKFCSLALVAFIELRLRVRRATSGRGKAKDVAAPA